MFVLDAETHECLHYESVIGYPPTKYAAIPREILEEHPEVEIRNDLIDCAIDVCSVEVSLSFCSLFPRLTCLLSHLISIAVVVDILDVVGLTRGTNS